MEVKKTKSKVIPEGELNCIWAEAGLVSYKLCDRNLECDDCPFDLVMRQRPAPASEPDSKQKKVRPGPSSPSVSRPAQSSLKDFVRDIFGRPFSEKLPEDRLYSHSHVWVKGASSGSCRIGIDHYAAALLDGSTGIVFPQAGASVVKNNPCAWIISEGGTIAIQSPVNGKIRSVNQKLIGSTLLIRSDPYDSGWLGEISSETDILATCFRASEMGPSSRSEFDTLEREIVAEFGSSTPAVGVTLMDGGSRPQNLRDVLGTVRYVSVLQRVFSSKP